MAALVFNDLKSNRVNDVKFKLEDALSMEGHTGPYVQFTHARLCSIERKFAEKFPKPPPLTPDLYALLGKDEEKQILLQLTRLTGALRPLCARFTRDPMARGREAVLERGLDLDEPSTICQALLTLSGAISSWLTAGNTDLYVRRAQARCGVTLPLAQGGAHHRRERPGAVASATADCARAPCQHRPGPAVAGSRGADAHVTTIQGIVGTNERMNERNEGTTTMGARAAAAGGEWLGVSEAAARTAGSVTDLDRICREQNLARVCKWRGRNAPRAGLIRAARRTTRAACRPCCSCWACSSWCCWRFSSTC